MGWVIGIFSSLVPYLVDLFVSAGFKFVYALGFGSVTYLGFDYLLDSVIDKVMSSVNGVPYVTLQFLHLMGLDVSLNTFLSAGATILFIKGMNWSTGSITKGTFSKPKGSSGVHWG